MVTKIEVSDLQHICFCLLLVILKFQPDFCTLSKLSRNVGNLSVYCDCHFYASINRRFYNNKTNLHYVVIGESDVRSKWSVVFFFIKRERKRTGFIAHICWQHLTKWVELVRINGALLVPFIYPNVAN